MIDTLRATWCCCLLSTGATCLLLAVTRTGVSVPSLLTMVGYVAVLAGLHLVYTRWRPWPRVAELASGMAAVIWAGLSAGVFALAALRTGAPLIDATLARLDAAFLIETPALVHWVAHRGQIGAALDIAYLSTVPMVFLAVGLLAWRRDRDRMWELCFSFAGVSFCSVLASAFIPAVGAFTFFKIDPQVVAALPAGAGTYFLATLEGFRAGRLTQIDMFHLDGVLEFPSFHAAMACMTAYSLRHIRMVGHLGWVWCAVVLLSTLPIGGHYAVDVLAGVLLWSAFALMVRFRVGVRVIETGSREIEQRAQVGAWTARPGV